MEFDEICEAILAYHKHTHLLFSLESLANLARNGRVKPAVAAVARMLGIRVIGQASESGELEVLCKTRGEHGALERIVLELKDRVKKMGFTGGTLELTGTDDAGIVSASQNAEQAVQALIVLGYTQSEAAQAVAKLDGSLSTEELIRGALKSMASRF